MARLDTELRKLGVRLRQLRDARHLSQGEAAQKIRIDKRTLGRLERGDGGPPAFTTLLAIALTYDVKLRDLFD